MIRRHLIANLPQTPVFAGPDSAMSLITSLPTGHWIGLIHEVKDWLHVLTTAGEGWVRRDDVKDLPPMSLHVKWTPGEPIDYIG